MSAAKALPASIDDTLTLLRDAGYVGNRALATVLFLSLRLRRPLLLEGEAGVGKTEIAKVLSASLGRKLIRLQCYEGLDVAAAVYEWNYAGQMMAIRLAEAGGAAADRDRLQEDVFSERFLVKRPLLQALEPAPDGPPVLLIDELDRADEAFEAFLLEILSDFQVTVPELGTVKASEPPIVIITSNRTRLPGRRARAGHRGRQGARRAGRTDARARRLRPEAAGRGRVQNAGRRRDPGLGDRADGARCRGTRPRGRRQHPRRPVEIPGRHRQDGGVAHEGHHRRGPGGAEPRMPATATPAASAGSEPMAPGLVPGRNCGTCSMCCKVFRIEEVEKVAGQWCRHVVPGRGCGIHATRPGICRTFFCHWLQNGTLGPEWKPERAKFLLYTENAGRRLVVGTDPAAPAAWRKAPYYAMFKRWAAVNLGKGFQILVFHGTRATAVLPDRDVALGTVNVGDTVLYHTADGRTEVEVRAALPLQAAG